MDRRKQTSLVTVTLSSLALALMDIAAVILAFGLYTVIRPKDQVLFQASIAALFVCAGCAALQEAIRGLRPAWAPPWSGRNWIGVQFAALAWSAAIFVPLHFATQGYLTAAGNVWALWLFQIPANALALAVAVLVGRRRPAGAS